jgi:diguanylate cyclase (GGDEF)-like protein
MVDTIATVLVAAGLAVHLVALSPARRLIAQLPPESSLRRQWWLLTALVGLFILGYAGYLVAFSGQHRTLADLVVPVVFFLGASFVLLVTRLSLATALDVRRIASLEQESITDALTGLGNRRYLDRRLAEEVARARRHGLPLSLLLLDIDHFKGINDAHGHAAGDRVLAGIGAIVRDTMRATDVAARYGGEEVAILAPQTESAAALKLAERLRERIEEKARRALSGTGAAPAVTASIGVAQCESSSARVAELLERADRALYRAKKEGRNRVVAA